MTVRWVVDLDDVERQRLESFVGSGSALVRKVKRAQILLAAATKTDQEIAATVSVGTSTVFRTKRRFVQGGVDHALDDDPRPGAGRKLSGKEEALLVATACSKPPAGRACWTMQLLADAMVELTAHSQVSRETVRRRLHEKEIKPWQHKMWCIPKVDAEYVARMEDVLDLYAPEASAPEGAPSDPVVCFDESPVQIIAETRTPLPAEPAESGKPSKPERVDYEYKRNGTANLFVFLDAHRPWRHVKVTDHRGGGDFAACMRDIVDVHYQHAERVRVVLDNLSTHSPAMLYEAFPAHEARRILRRLEFHFVPKHASWLNMVEIEIGVLKSQCLDRRIGDRAALVSEIAAWEQARNAEGARIRWMFTVQRARTRMARAYPTPKSAARSTEQPLSAAA